MQSDVEPSVWITFCFTFSAKIWAVCSIVKGTATILEVYMTLIFVLSTCPINKVSEKADPLYLSPLTSSAVSLRGWAGKVDI